MTIILIMSQLPLVSRNNLAPITYDTIVWQILCSCLTVLSDNGYITCILTDVRLCGLAICDHVWADT